MRVSAIDTINTERVSRGEAAAADSPDRATLFSRTVSQAARDNYEQFIRTSIDAITAQGERVAKRADLGELQKYREMIRSLLGETVSNAFEFSKFSRFDSRGRSKVFALIQQVDKKLDDMTQSLLAQEADNISLLADVGEIRGLLVDILM